MSQSPSLLSAKDQWLQLALTKRWLTEQELLAAVAKAQAEGMEPAIVLCEAGKLTYEQLGMLRAEAAGVAFIKLEDYQIDPEALKLVPESIARKHQLLPLHRVDRALTIALAKPWDAVAIDAVRAKTQLPLINCVVGTPEAIRKAIEHFYGLQLVEQAAGLVAHVPAELTDQAAAALAKKPAAEAANEVPVIKLVDALINEALELKASDIHIEPDGEHTRLRLRVDGVLHEARCFPIALHEALTSRIKILAKLDITEHRLPQDGNIQMNAASRAVDCRISTYPTISGENVVIRLLDQSAVALNLTDLGLRQDALNQLQRLIHQPHGILLVSGPTGSGKTTTLYAALQQINDMAKNIMTIEDPVEYHVSLIRQTQINLKAGVTFAAGLRSILRQDPDVIMVGEIRDQEAAEIAMQAALTGHLVLSTLHTNDAPSAITRLLDMDVESYLLASTMLGVMGQRLVRRVCASCQEGSRPPKELRERYPKLTTLMRGRGCRVCRMSGYVGRIGIFELFIITDDVKAKIAAKVPSHVLKQMAIQAGMRTMREDGLLKVQQGLTTLEEIDRVVPPELSR